MRRTASWLVAMAGLTCVAFTNPGMAAETTDAMSDTSARTGLVRLGDHGDFVRIVIETPTKQTLRQVLAADGRRSVVTISTVVALRVPKAMVRPILSVDLLPVADDKTEVAIGFRQPMKLSGTMVLNPENGGGYRVVLDFAPMPEGQTAVPIAASAPVTASPPGNGHFILTGFRSAHFGRDKSDVRRAIKADFGRDIPMADVATDGAGGSAIEILAEVGGLENAQITYYFDAPDNRLIRIELVWGQRTGGGLNEDETHDLVAAVTRGYRDAGLDDAHNVFEGKLLNGSTIGFYGIDNDGRRAILTIMPVTESPREAGPPAPAGRSVVRLSLVESKDDAVNPAAP